jgi:hypothetical protein
MTAAEIAFIKAEALHRSGDKPGALTAYRNGISLHFDMLTSTFETNVPDANKITPTAKADYLNSTVIVPAAAADLTLTHIMLQKYIALYIHGACETWVDMRRYHYLDTDPQTGQQVYRDFALPNVIFADNNGKTVQRVRPRYNSEYVWNMNELIRIGADPSKLDYHTRECWFSQP